MDNNQYGSFQMPQNYMNMPQQDYYMNMPPQDYYMNMPPQDNYMNMPTQDNNMNYPSYWGYPNTYPQVPVQMPTEDMDGLDEMDMKYMKRMYPEICKEIQRYVDEECDKLEYESSCMYDEYPERERIEMIIDKIYDKVKDKKVEMKEMEVEETDLPRQFYGGYNNNQILRGLVGALLLNEMFGRRRRIYRRRRRRPFYSPYGYGWNNNPFY